MLNWFKKKPRLLADLHDDALTWSVATFHDPQDGPTIMRYVSDRSLPGHPELPWRLGVAIEHRYKEQQRDWNDPLYGEMEDRLLALLSGPPRCGVFVLSLRNHRMLEWVSYCRTDGEARSVGEKMGEHYGDRGVTAMYTQDPRWDVLRDFARIR